METVAILLSVTAAAMLMVLIGRLFWILLKIALIVFLLWLLMTRLPVFKSQPTQPPSEVALARGPSTASGNRPRSG